MENKKVELKKEISLLLENIDINKLKIIKCFIQNIKK